MSHNLHVEIDRAVCIGAADCIRIAAAAFDLGDDDIAVVTNPEAVDETVLRAAARSCPSGAIVIREADDVMP